MNIQTNPGAVLKKLLVFIFFLVSLNMLGIISRFYFNHGSIYGLIQLVNFDQEKNIPTLYSSITLLISSGLLLNIAITHKRNGSSYLPWLGLAFIFLFLSIDEISSIHERLIIPVENAFNTSGVFYFAWVIPYSLAVIVFFISYLRFLTRLPKKIMVLFIVSGAIFVMGAIGFEMINGRHVGLYGSNNITYSLLYTCEETLEMIGIAIFIYTLLRYIIMNFQSFEICVSEP